MPLIRFQDGVYDSELDLFRPGESQLKRLPIEWSQASNMLVGMLVLFEDQVSSDYIYDHFEIIRVGVGSVDLDSRTIGSLISDRLNQSKRDEIKDNDLIIPGATPEMMEKLRTEGFRETRYLLQKLLEFQARLERAVIQRRSHYS